MVIFLSKDIDNEDGYIDGIVSQIQQVPKGEDLELAVTSGGGDIFQAERIYNAIMQHEGRTLYTGIGAAASAAATLGSAFDVVDLDSDIEFMVHKARPAKGDIKDASEEQRGVINRWNQRAYTRFLKKGGDKDFLAQVFLNEEYKDFYLTAKEAQSYGLGNAVQITRENGDPMKIAAKKEYESKLNHKEMFGKTKEKGTLKVLAALDGRQIAFMSEGDQPIKGSVLTVVGSNELLTGKVAFEKFVASVGEANEVEAIEEAPEAEVSDEEKASMMERLDALEAAVQSLVDALKPAEDEAVIEAKKEEDEKIEAKKAEGVEAVKALMDEALAVAATIKTGFKLGRVEDKHEPLMSRLTEKELRIQAIRQS